MIKKIETGDVEVGELVKKIQMSESKVGKDWRSAGSVKRHTRNLSRMRCWQRLGRKMHLSSAATT